MLEAGELMIREMLYIFIGLSAKSVIVAERDEGHRPVMQSHAGRAQGFPSKESYGEDQCRWIQ